MTFPTQVNVVQAPAVAGDFADKNPRATVDAGPGALVAGAAGVTVGRFAWVDPANQSKVSNTGFGQVSGFIARVQQALITLFLAEGSNVVPSGYPVTLHSGGGFWVQNDGTTEALFGQKAYANYADGRVSFAATGAPTTASGTASSIAAATAISVTGTIVGNVFTAVSGLSGTIVPGAILTGTGVATGTQVTAQLTGTTGGLGTYTVNIPDQAVTSTTIGGTYGTLTVGGTVTGTFVVGSTLSGSGVTAGTTIWGLGTGTGGIGTYSISLSQSVISEPMTAATTYVNSVPKARINSTVYAIQYAAAIAALGSWAQISNLQIGSANSPDAVVVGHIAGNLFYVTSVTSGTVRVNDFLTDANGLIINGTYIVSGSSSPYTINNSQTVSGATFTGTNSGSSTTFTASAVTGVIRVGDTITGGTIPAGTTIVTAAVGGGAGTYTTSVAVNLSGGVACTTNQSINCASADQTYVQVNANQVPQIIPTSILVSVA
jgi:hypothetical protein